jgi:hypothetical protein
MGYEINWSMNNPSIKSQPLYQKWSVALLSDVVTAKALLITDMKGMVMNDETAEVASYLAWLLRMVNLLAE